MTEETKRTSRAKKTEQIIEVPAAVEQVQTMTFAEVAAWNRANAEKLPPAIQLERKQRPKSKRI